MPLRRHLGWGPCVLRCHTGWGQTVYRPFYALFYAPFWEVALEEAAELPKAKLLTIIGSACFLTLVTGSRVTSQSGTAPGFTAMVALSMACTACAAFALGLLFSRRPAALARVGIALTFVLCASGFTLAALAVSTGSAVGTTAGAAWAILVGCGIGCGYVLWGAVFTRFARRDLVVIIPMSSLLWCATGGLVTLIDAYGTRMTVLGVFLVTSCACYIAARRTLDRPSGDALAGGCGHDTETAASVPSSAPVPSLGSVFPVVWKVVLLVSVLGFASGIMRVLSAVALAEPATLSVLRLVSGALAVAVFLVLFGRGRSAVTTSAVTLVTLLATASAFMLLPAIDIRYQVFLACFVDIGYLFAGMLLNLSCAMVGEGDEGKAALASGAAQGVSIAFTAAGFVVSSGMNASGDSDVRTVWELAMLAVYLIVIILVMVNMPSLRGALRQGRSGDAKNAPILMVSAVSENDIRTNEELVSRYGVTGREMDIVILTLTGRNAAGIAEILYLSENTVRTYLKRVYKKLDVHSKEELRDLVERAVERTRSDGSR